MTKALKEMTPVYARLKDGENMRFIYQIMAETDQPMCSIIEAMIEFCKVSPEFKITPRMRIVDRAIDKVEEARRKRMARYSRLAKGKKPKEI